jgi:DNA-binding SARP family transcriptional activator
MGTGRARDVDDGGGDGLEVHLLGRFQLMAGERPVTVPHGCERVIALVAVHHPAALGRPRAAALLWPDLAEARAAASLRSALWRLHRRCEGVVDADERHLRLGPRVWTDVHAPVRMAAPAGVPTTRSRPALELLPGWYDEWLVVERERVRQSRLHAIESAARDLLGRGCCDVAIDLGLQAVAAEPLRESAHRIVIEAHLAEGNVVEALQQYERCCEVLRTELAIAPSPSLRQLVATVRRPVTHR